MLVYNVTVNLDEDIEEDWLSWMREEHLKDLLNTGCFVSYRLSKLMDAPASSGVSYSVQYDCPSPKDYERYIQDHADTMRLRGLERFGSRFQVFRTLMEVVDQGKS